MIEKKKLLKECLDIFRKPNVEEWYKKNLKEKNQYYTINSLEKGVQTKELSIREALALALVIGVQWNVNFEREK